VSTADRRQRERDAVRAKLLDTAWELLADRPVEEVTMRLIADRAEYSPRTLYLYFQDKDDLLAAVVEQAYARTLDHQDEVLPGPVEGPWPQSFIRQQVRRHLVEALASPRLYEAVYFHLWRPGHEPGPHQRAVEGRIGALASAAGASPEEAALVPVLLRSWALTQVRRGLGPQDPGVEAAADAFSDFLLRGLGLPAP